MLRDGEIWISDHATDLNLKLLLGETGHSESDSTIDALTSEFTWSGPAEVV